MNANPIPAVPEAIRTEMARLTGAGLRLLPLGGGEDGKAPLLRRWADPGVTLSQILGPMFRNGSQVYGIRLEGLAVVDCDTDDPKLVEQLEARFGASPVHVKTPRGRHLYYRAGGAVPNLRSEGLQVDIKTGARSYVVGPLSVRPDGGIYTPLKGELGIDDLPPLKLSTVPSAPSVPILTGHRHVTLVREALQMVEYVDCAEELQANLKALRDNWCADPGAMPDAELCGIAAWVWQCRLENRVYAGRNSAFKVQRTVLDALKGLPNNADALALYVTLVDYHGHRPGKSFPLAFDAMREAGILSLSKPRLREARRTLERIGVLRLVGKHKAGSKRQTYALATLNSVINGASNVTPLANTASLTPSRKQGGGTTFTYDARFQTNKSEGRSNG